MNDNTSYREKGRAVFLAAIMVLSVVAMSAAFAGGAAAAEPKSISDDEIGQQAVWEGQVLNISNDQVGGFDENSNLELRSVSETEDGNVTSSSLVTELTVTDDGTNAYVEVDTDGAEGDHAIRVDGSYFLNSTGDADATDSIFEVSTQDFDVEWGDEEVTEADDEVDLEVDTNRNDYNVTIAADGLDYDQLYELFVNHSAAVDGLDVVDVNDSAHLPLNSLGGPGDDGHDLVDDDYLTLNLSDSDFSGSDDLVANFTHLEDTEGIDEDTYEFEVYVTDSSAEDTAEIEFREEDVDGSFSQGVYTQTAGDYQQFTLELEDTDEAWIQIGDENAGFVDIVHVSDDSDNDEVSFWVNTRLLGTDVGSDAVYWTDDDEIEASAYHDGPGNVDNLEFIDGDDAQLADFDEYLNDLGLISTSSGEDYQDQIVRPLQPTDYSLTASGDGVFVADDGESEADNELDQATLDLTTPEIGEINTYVAPAEDADDADLEELLTEVEMTPRTEVAEGDRLIIEVEASGMYGALGLASDEHFSIMSDGVSGEGLHTLTDTNPYDGEGINFEVQADDAIGNQDPTSLDLNTDDDDEVYVLVDNANGAFYVVVDTDSDVWDGNLDTPHNFDVEFEYETHDDDRYYFDNYDQDQTQPGPLGATESGDPAYPYFGADSTESVSTEFDVADPAVDFANLDADDNVQIATSEDAVISGETNVAPGSEADIRIRNAGDTPSFLNTPSAEIGSDGTFESEEVDFSDRAEDDEATVTFRVGGSNVDSADGIFVESVDEPEEDDDAPEEDDTPEEDDEPPETDDEPPETDDDPAPPSDDDEPVDTEDDGVPGFGLAIAVVALLAAAMLALRRQN